MMSRCGPKRQRGRAHPFATIGDHHDAAACTQCSSDHAAPRCIGALDHCSFLITASKCCVCSLASKNSIESTEYNSLSYLTLDQGPSGAVRPLTKYVVVCDRSVRSL